eukprot:2900424-Heterocapsa_arctica.AAC.1
MVGTCGSEKAAQRSFGRSGSGDPSGWREQARKTKQHMGCRAKKPAARREGTERGVREAGKEAIRDVMD